MNIEEPNYYNKYRIHRSDRTGEAKFLSYLEQLNQIDWTDFIEDIISKKSWILTIAQPSAETNLLSYFAEFFDKLGSTSNRLLREALNSLARKFIAEPTSQERKIILIGAIKLSKILGWGISKDILARSFVTDNKVPDEIRELSAITLALYDDPPPIDFWTNDLNLNKCPFLAYSKLLALHDVKPAEALSIYQLLNSAPDNIDKLRIPTLKAIRNLLSDKDGFLALHEKLGSMQTWAQVYIKEEILELDELKKLEPYSIQVSDQHPKEEQLPDPYIYADRERFSAILGANGNDPLITKLKSPLTTIPDHTLPWIAQKKGFLGWFNVGLEDPSIDPNISNLEYPHAHKVLFKEDNQDGDALIAEPRVFLGPNLMYSTDVAVSNIFRGYAIIGPKNENLKPFNPNDIDSFWILLTSLYERHSTIGVIDPGGEKLVSLLRNMIRETTKASGYINTSMVNLRRGIDNLIDRLQRGSIDFMIGAVPSKVIAQQLKMKTYLEFESLPKVVNKIRDNKTKGYWLKHLEMFRREYTLHNCWNLNLSYENCSKFRNEELILRLASAAFFTIEYINKNTTEVTRYIADLWNQDYNDQYQLDYDIFEKEFNKSYRFIGFNECEDILFNQESDYCYPRALAIHLKAVDQHDRSNFRDVFDKLKKYKESYEEKIKRCSIALKTFRGSNETLMKSKSFYQRARCFSKIRNYHDANICVDEAILHLKSA